GVAERAEPPREVLQGLARERRLRRLPRHRQLREPVGAAQVGGGAAPPPAAHTAAGLSAGAAMGRFHGIFRSTSAIPPVPVAPAKVRPPPTNAGTPRNHGLTSTPSAVPARTRLPAMSCTWRSTARRLRPSRTGCRPRRQASIPPSITRGR